MRPSTPQVPERAREQEGGGNRSHFSALTDLHACSSHFPGIQATPLPGGSVLHYLSALAAWSCRGCEGKKDGAEAPSILLADAPVDFCFWSLFGSGVPSRRRALPNSRSPEVQLTSSNVSGCG
ncbi:B230217C12Rik [Phodopus roborovskii]|uniref:B230217C12Rik protein n=1 Tax=Phodopus roborovskii TaxID=109678 RepID=A0AAU9YL27_PHORO|nr:B230217C12Rik [Phodopus roborovskii]